MSKLLVCAAPSGLIEYVPFSFCIDQLCSKVRVKVTKSATMNIVRKLFFSF